jgi:para-nitrobenzyl esterase
MADHPVVEIASGRLRGASRHGVLAFKGIPYAAPPVGPLRWQPPQPPAPWAGVRDATEYGCWAPQNRGALDDVMGAEIGPQSEDCLTLNVWTPGLDGRRPVMVWIHGGGFTIGSGAQGIYEGATLAAHGDLVVVTLNYRLGILGFAPLAGVTGGRIPATGNEGLLDQVQALTWVRDHIARFGGDPARVTLFGESAGGMSVGSLLAVPAARGLLHAAIPQSGACHTCADAGTAELRGAAILAATGLDAEGLRAASCEELLRAQRLIEGGNVQGYPLSRIGSLPFTPVADGRVLPVKPIDAVAGGAAAGIPLLAGSTLDEWNLFGAPARAIQQLDEAGLYKRLGYLVGAEHAPGLVAAYREALPARGGRPGIPELFMAIQTDRIFRIPALRLLERQGPHEPRVFNYLFDWSSPAMGGRLGAAHAIELAYVFGTYTKPGALKFYGGAEPGAAELAALTMDAWARFAHQGDPGWPAYEPGRRLTAVLGKSRRLLEKPLEAERRAWDGVPDQRLGTL